MLEGILCLIFYVKIASADCFSIICVAAMAEQQKRLGFSYEGKVYERRDAQSSKVGFSILHLLVLCVIFMAYSAMDQFCDCSLLLQNCNMVKMLDVLVAFIYFL